MGFCSESLALGWLCATLAAMNDATIPARLCLAEFDLTASL
jgi:hypothetical protein